MTIELIISDWEGCVGEPGGGRKPWPIKKMVSLRDALRKLAVPFVLCTGRQFPYVEATIQALDIFSDIPSVAENGVGLYYPKTKEVRLHPAITPDIEKMMDRVRIRAYQIVTFGGTRGYGKEMCISLDPPETLSIEEFHELVIKRLSEFSDAIQISHSRSAVDITPKGINKGSGVEFLSEVSGIELAATVGIGDSQGDLAMLQLVGHPACPANADDEVKRLVEYVSSYRTIDGVLDIIKHYTQECPH